jgi:hypothetical protein
MTYDDTNWLPSLFRTLNDFISGAVDSSVQGNSGGNSGLKVYRLTFDFPAAATVADELPFRGEDGRPQSIIHFVIDDIDNHPLGMGDNVVDEILSEDELTLIPVEAEMHMVNFDVGIWATDASGGSTARLVAYQMLSQVFGPTSAKESFQTLTGGLEIVSFRGGRMIQETVNDIRLYRVIDSELIIRAYSRQNVPDQPVVGDVAQNTGLIIGDTIIIDVP